MARATKTGKELSFHPKRKCWCKNYQDEYGNRNTKTFGRGTSARDQRSYEAALEKYYPWKRSLETRKALVKLQALLTAVLEGQLPVSALGDSPWAMRMIGDFKAKGHINEHGFYDPDNPTITIRPMFELPSSEAAPKHMHADTIQAHVDAWLASEEAKHKANPKDLSATAVRDKRLGIRTFAATDFDCFGAGRKRFGSSAKVDQLCLDYKAWLLERMQDEDSNINKPNTVNDKTKFAKQFLEWCWTRGILKELPRTLKEMAKKLYVKKGGEPLELDVVLKLWDAAGDRMKCFMLLGLNCAFKPGDVSSTTGDMIQGKRLLGTRKKTEKHTVPMNYALWPSTLTMIQRERDHSGKADLLFVNSKGERINTSTFSSLFRKVADRAGVKAKFEQLRDTSAQLVVNELMQNGYDLAYKQIFIAHKDNSTAAYYLDDDPKHLQTPHLDKIVLGLEKTYGLKLPPVKPKPKT